MKRTLEQLVPVLLLSGLAWLFVRIYMGLYFHQP